MSQLSKAAKDNLKQMFLAKKDWLPDEIKLRKSSLDKRGTYQLSLVVVQGNVFRDIEILTAAINRLEIEILAAFQRFQDDPSARGSYHAKSETIQLPGCKWPVCVGLVNESVHAKMAHLVAQRKNSALEVAAREFLANPNLLPVKLDRCNSQGNTLAKSRGFKQITLPTWPEPILLSFSPISHLEDQIMSEARKRILLDQQRAWNEFKADKNLRGQHSGASVRLPNCIYSVTPDSGFKFFQVVGQEVERRNSFDKLPHKWRYHLNAFSDFSQNLLAMESNYSGKTCSGPLLTILSQPLQELVLLWKMIAPFTEKELDQFLTFSGAERIRLAQLVADALQYLKESNPEAVNSVRFPLDLICKIDQARLDRPVQIHRLILMGLALQAKFEGQTFTSLNGEVFEFHQLAELPAEHPVVASLEVLLCLQSPCGPI